MTTGTQSDFLMRLKATLPVKWFGDATPALDALLCGISNAWASLYAFFVFIGQQSRIATATGPFLDGAAVDFCGFNLARFAGETDLALSARIRATFFQPQGTRAAVAANLVALTGRAPAIFEPANPIDTGAWGTQPAAPWAYSADFTVSAVWPEWTTKTTCGSGYNIYSAANLQSVMGPANAAINGAAWTAVVEWVDGATGIAFGATDGSGFSHSIYATISGSVIGLTVANAAGVIVNTPGISINSGVFATNRIAISVGGGVAAISVNGSIWQSVPYVGPLPTYTVMTLGASPWAYDNPIGGVLTRVAIYASARSAADLQKLSVVGYQIGLEMPTAFATGLGYGVAGGYGSLALPFQAFVVAYRRTGGGVANVAGYYLGSGWAGGGYGVGAIEYASPNLVLGSITDAAILNTINTTRPVASIAWTRLSA